MGQPADAVRSFNRFYTKQIGLLRKGYLDSRFTLSEVRVLYELAYGASLTASDLVKKLDLDPGYLSRTLRSFEKEGLIGRKPSPSDARQSLVTLTAKGRRAFQPLDRKSHDETAAMLGKLSPMDQVRLIQAMHTIERLLGPPAPVRYKLRRHRPGDMGWVIHRHGALYNQEYGWDARFEALVAEIAAKFIHNYDPKRERCWIAESDGAIIGFVFLVRQTDTIANLRMLLVEPSARGLGLGIRLVNECVRFARKADYRKITLWTQSNLDAARGIYEKTGFQLVHQEPNPVAFGKNLISETWNLAL
jgi:DNA-binding MarR family transcriptional regulator/GNAT superfamily N-acetyltransferase